MADPSNHNNTANRQTPSSTQPSTSNTMQQQPRQSNVLPLTERNLAKLNWENQAQPRCPGQAPTFNSQSNIQYGWSIQRWLNNRDDAAAWTLGAGGNCQSKK